jgi:phospholipase/carboxylesterase
LLDHEVKLKDPSQIILGGFDFGGAMALYAGLRYRHKLAGIVSFSGFVPLPEDTADYMSEDGRDTPILVYHGKNDKVIPLPYAKERYDILKQAGCNIEMRVVPNLGHHMSPETMLQMQTWWRDKLKV